MTRPTVRIGTRGSDLALWQAHHVAARLGVEVDTEIVVIKTRGDAIDNKPLQQVEGKAFFTAEIEQALLDGDVDLAVHSHKDLATESPDGLAIVAVPERGPAAERLLIRADKHDPSAAWLPLAPEASVGTSSPRRASQLLTLRGDLCVTDLRGNVPTRVRRLREGRYDAIVLAEAGLVRLALDTSGLVSVTLGPELLVPAPAQGALAIQVRADDAELTDRCRRLLHDPATAAIVAAERSLLARFGGGCHLPLGVHVAPSASEGFAAWGFLGAGVPDATSPPRWAETRGASPAAAADALHAALAAAGATGFGPLAGVSMVLVGSSDDGTALGTRLVQLGARVHHERVLAFQDVGAPDLPARMARLKPGDVLAVTSQEAARRLSGQRVAAGVAVAAVGPATARALASVGIRAGIVGQGGARELTDLIDVPAGGSVLFPCAKEARPDLPDALAARGIQVDRVVLYRTVHEASSVAVPDAQARVYMSPSAVLSSVSLGREGGDGDDVIRIGLGGATCDTLQDEGLDHDRPRGSGPEAVIALLAQLLGRGHSTAS